MPLELIKSKVYVLAFDIASFRLENMMFSDIIWVWNQDVQLALLYDVSLVLSWQQAYNLYAQIANLPVFYFKNLDEPEF